MPWPKLQVESNYLFYLFIFYFWFPPEITEVSPDEDYDNLAKNFVDAEEILPADLVASPPCQSYDPSPVGYLFKYIKGGKWWARKCPNTPNCVQIAPCPWFALQCFEVG